MTGAPGERLHRVLGDRRAGAWAVAVLAVLVYANAVALGFAYDDVLMIQGNAALHGWDGILASVGAPYWSGRNGAELGLWRPISTTWWGCSG